MKEVDVPLIDQTTCQNQLRATRLGQNFQMDFTSFLCAGGESGKDAVRVQNELIQFSPLINFHFVGPARQFQCTGDGGAPLVCQIVNQFYVLGLGNFILTFFYEISSNNSFSVAWGIGCGQQSEISLVSFFQSFKLGLKYFTDVPGVYTNVANYIPWIQQTTRS
jgi:hypothetical protein